MTVFTLTRAEREALFLLLFKHKVDPELLAPMFGDPAYARPEHHVEPKYIPIDRKDVCAMCHADYGMTMSGRVRNGCPSCYPKILEEGAKDYYDKRWVPLNKWMRYTGQSLEAEWLDFHLKYMGHNNE